MMSEHTSGVRVIVNADDLGHSQGPNRGIEEGHRHGIITSASLMVNRPATAEGVRVAHRNPALSVGLHLNVTDEDWEAVDLADAAWVERELEAQYALFCDLVGRPPTHLDSHHHIHWKSEHTPTFQRFAAEHSLPLRHYSSAEYIGHFYGQWEHGVTELTPVQEPYLQELLEGFTPGLYELACHPGYVTPDLNSLYSIERETELATLQSPVIRVLVDSLGIQLCSFATESVTPARENRK